MTTPSFPEILREAAQAALAEGWIYDTTTRNHGRLTPPPGARGTDGQLLAPVTWAGTPSDHRAHRNALSALRQRVTSLRAPYRVVATLNGRWGIARVCDGAVVLNNGGHHRTFRSEANAQAACKRLCAEIAAGAPHPPLTQTHDGADH